MKCKTCEEVKPSSEFRKDKAMKSGYRSTCRACLSEQDRVRYHARRKTNPDYQESNRNSRYKYLYGITTEDYNLLLEKQHHKCALCKRHDDEFKTRLAVDHDHNTGEIRGLLCRGCNLALGRLGDTEESLLRVIKYLKACST